MLHIDTLENIIFTISTKDFKGFIYLLINVLCFFGPYLEMFRCSGFAPGSTLKNYSYLCLRDHMVCWEISLDWSYHTHCTFSPVP